MTGTPLAAYRQMVEQAADFLSKKAKTPPSVGLVTGTVWGNAAGFIEQEEQAEFSRIPHFPQPTAEAHEGRAVLGQYAGKGICAFRGRFHLYEGYSPLQVIFPIRVLGAMGVRTLFLLNASGGVNPGFSTGTSWSSRTMSTSRGKTPWWAPMTKKPGPGFGHDLWL